METAFVSGPYRAETIHGIAYKNLGMDFIGIEKDAEYFKIAKARVGQ